jgi:hypothetical protein
MYLALDTPFFLYFKPQEIPIWYPRINQDQTRIKGSGIVPAMRSTGLKAKWLGALAVIFKNLL